MQLDHFKLRQLRIVLALHEQGKLGEVADMFGITQPGLSRTLAEMEARLGFRLFDRHARGITVTPEGEILVRQIKLLLVDAERAEYELRGLAAGKRGTVAFGTIMTPASDVVPPALAALFKSHPEIDISIEVGSSSALLGKILSHELDFAVCRFSQGSDAARFHYRPLGGETLRLVVSTDHPLAKKQAVINEDLRELDWILQPPGSFLRQVVEDFHRRHNVFPRTIVSTSSTLLTMLTIRQSNRVGIFSRNVAEMFDRHGLLRALPLDADVGVPDFGVIYLKDRDPSPAARAMINALIEAANSGAAGVTELLDAAAPSP